MSVFPRCFAAVLFDLDGVLTDTAHAHYLAWKRLADELGIPFDAKTNEALKGVDRMGSLDLILALGERELAVDERIRLTERKDAWYREMITGVTPADLFPGARAVLEATREAGLAIALVSASRNAAVLVERLGITALFDTIVDPASVTNSKPAPDLFLAAAAALNVKPERCLGIEDAPAGITALHAAGMAAIGIGSSLTLAGADAVIPTIKAFRLNDYHAC